MILLIIFYKEVPMETDPLVAEFTRSMVAYASAQLKDLPAELIALRRRHRQWLRHPVPFTLQRGDGRDELLTMMKTKFEMAFIADGLAGPEIHFL